MFQGFYEETIQFLWELRLNNQRPWVPGPQAGVSGLPVPPHEGAGGGGPGQNDGAVPQKRAEPAGGPDLSDARRIHSGGPYKEHLWFTLSTAVGELASAPVFYFEVMPEGYEYGMGYYCPRPSLMAAYRQQILAAPAQLERLARKLNRQSLFVLEGEEYKRPKGQVSPLLAPWFNRKTLSLSAAYPPDDCFLTPALTDRVTEGFAWLMPYYRYLKKIAPRE